MRDSQRDSGGYPRRTISRSASNQSSLRNRQSEPTGQIRPPARRPGMAGPGQAPAPRIPLNSDNPPSKRPRLPYAEETREAQFERTERLRALRQDFLDHAQTKIKPQKPRNVWLAVALTGVMLVLCIIGVVAFFQLRTTVLGGGGQAIATQFLQAMQQKDYKAAYADCAPNVQEAFTDHSGTLSQADFIQQAQASDQLGPITNFTQTGSNTIDANNEQYTFKVTRSHQTPVNITLGVTKGSDGTWKVSSIDSALLPSPPQQPQSNIGLLEEPDAIGTQLATR